jgi:hypothetical protein
MLTQARLKELLRYDRKTGNFFWRVPRGSRTDLVGTQAGGKHWKGYWNIEIDAQEYRAHRLAWLYVYGRFPNEQLDHINRIKDDNRIVNLRLASQTQNGANSKAKPSRSGLKGAHWNARYGGKWSSHILYNGKDNWLGYFATAEEAHTAYCKAAKKLHGEYFHPGG